MNRTEINHTTCIDGYVALNTHNLRPMWGAWAGPYPNALCRRGVWVFAAGCDTPARFVGVTPAGNVWLAYGRSYPANHGVTKWYAPDFDELCEDFDELIARLVA